MHTTPLSSRWNLACIYQAAGSLKAKFIGHEAYLSDIQRKGLMGEARGGQELIDKDIWSSSGLIAPKSFVTSFVSEHDTIAATHSEYIWAHAHVQEMVTLEWRYLHQRIEQLSGNKRAVIDNMIEPLNTRRCENLMATPNEGNFSCNGEQAVARGVPCLSYNNMQSQKKPLP